MLKLTGRACLLLLLMTLITGILYSLTVTGLASVLFSRQAGGSLVYRDGRPVDSVLIGQNFIGPGYFHGRPSAAGRDGYDAAASSGSNLGPTSKKLSEDVAGEAARVRSENGLSKGSSVPGDMVTSLLDNYGNCCP